MSLRNTKKGGFPIDEYTRLKQFKKYREAIRNPPCLLDRGPPLMVPSTFLNVRSLKADHNVLRTRMRQNLTLLVKINKIQRDTGFTENRQKGTYSNQSKFRAYVKWLQRVHRENLLLGKRLIAVKSKLETRNYRVPAPRKIKRYHLKPPKEMVRVYSRVLSPISRLNMESLLRPHVYFDLEVVKIGTVGRIVFELYTEACPELVLEVVRVVVNRDLEAIKFIRIFEGLWMEGEIYMFNAVLSRPNVPHCLHVIDHSCIGVLSFGRRFTEDGFPPGLANFTVAFKPLEVANNQRVAFGVVTKGLRFFDSLQEYGTKNGIVKKPVIVTACGLLN